MRIHRGLLVATIGIGLAVVGWAQTQTDNDFVVHEWGTFTSMQGSDGVTLEGLHHEEEALPGFVHNYAGFFGHTQRDLELRKGMPGLLCKVTEKMETPVTYFYSKKARFVRARVMFNHGLLSQWYPYAFFHGLPGGKLPSVIDVSRIERSSLEWDIDLLPPGKDKELLSKVGDEDPWRFARLPDSSLVRPVKAPAVRDGATETEKFLFYRGLGEFTLPIKATTEPGARLTIANNGDEAIRHLFILHVRDGRGVYEYVPKIEARQSFTTQKSFCKVADSVKEMVVKLKDELQKSLVAEGLYSKEAEAMASTWERSYFHTEGLRVLYVVPDRVTEQLLPLQVDPAPKEMKRVLVGRLECLMPEVEARVVTALRDRSSDNASIRDASTAQLNRLGRFLEPQVRRALAASIDPLVQKNGNEILKSLQPRGR